MDSEGASEKGLEEVPSLYASEAERVRLGYDFARRQLFQSIEDFAAFEAQLHGASNFKYVCRPKFKLRRGLRAEQPAKFKMGGRVERPKNGAATIRRIVAPASEPDFLDNLTDGMKALDLNVLLRDLEDLTSDKDADIEYMCTGNHQEFVHSVNSLNDSRGQCTELGSEILSLVQSYQSSTDNLAAQKKNLVDSRGVRQNVDDSTDALKKCLEVLRLSNQVHDLVAKQLHYPALRALEDLKNVQQIRGSSQFKISDMIQQSIPATQNMIAAAVMEDLNTWLFRIREISQYIGEVAFYHMEQRRSRLKERAEKDSYLASFKLNSPVELIADEAEEYDCLNDDEADIKVEFTPLFECIHIHEALGQMDTFRSSYAQTRRSQRDLIIPGVLRINDDEASDLKSLLEGITGFCVVERATMAQTRGLRSQSDVDELWTSMVQNAVNLMNNAIQPVKDAEILLKITGVVSLFIQTMESIEFTASSLNDFLLKLFEKYTQLLQARCNDDFDEIVSTDDYMPMPVSNLEEYDKIIDVAWYDPDRERDDINFPHVLPFSQMYPMCCIDIRNFLNQVYSAPDEYLQRSSVIDETIRMALDQLLCEKICNPLINRLNSQYPGIIVQILANVGHFEKACLALQKELAEFRTSRSQSGPVVLTATEQFSVARNRAEQRIYELVNSKIDDLTETAEYEWTAMIMTDEPSNYMNELTRYLSTLMSSVLFGLPNDIKHGMYFAALSHAAEGILRLPLDPAVTAITPPSVHRLSTDITLLSAFVSSLSLPNTNPDTTEVSDDNPSILRRTLDELTQTVELMASENPEDFFDISQRNKKFGSVNAQNGALLLDKVERGKQEFAMAAAAAAASAGMDVDGKGAGVRTYGARAEETRVKATERFGNVMRGFRSQKFGEGGNA